MRKSKQAREAEAAVDEEQDEPREERSRPPKPKRDRELQEKAATVPHDPVNEQVVIAAAIVSPKDRTKLVRVFLPEHFYGKSHAAAWSALTEIDRRGLNYDPATIRQLAGDAKLGEYLDALIAERPAAPPNLQYHVECMLLDRRRVELARGPLAEILEALHDTTTDVEQLRRIARRIGTSFDGAGSLRYLREPAAVTSNARQRLRERRERFAQGRAIYPYGILGVDYYEDGKTPRVASGTAPRQMTLVVGVSGAGKTTWTNQVVLAQANAGRRVLHGAWEQDAETNLEMLAAYSLGLSRSRLWQGDLTDEELGMLDEEIDRLGGGDRPLVRFFDLPFDQNCGQDKKQRHRFMNDENLDVIHEHVERSGCEVAIFDLYAKALVETKPEDEKRALDRQLAIAKATNTHHILLHHLRKEDLSSRRDHRPTREAIKGSTAWIDAFDTVFGLHIPGVWKDVPMTEMEVIFLKQRYGRWPLGVSLDYDPDTGVVSGGRTFDYRQIDANDNDSLNGWLDGEREESKKGGRRGR